MYEHPTIEQIQNTRFTSNSHKHEQEIKQQ